MYLIYYIQIQYTLRTIAWNVLIEPEIALCIEKHVLSIKSNISNAYT